MTNKMEVIENQTNKINKRFLEVRKALKLTQAQMANRVGFARPYLSEIETGSKNVSKSTIYSYIENLNVSRKWLETGEGEMFLEKTSANPRLEAKPIGLASDPNDFDNDGSSFEELPDGTIRMRVPIVPAKAFAGYLRGFEDPEFYDGLNMISFDVLKQHKGHYLAFEVVGDSMTSLEPENFRRSIFDGVIVIARELLRHHWQYKLHTHSFDSWVIVHKTEGILLKQIINQDIETGFITIHSLNPDKKTYPDQNLFLDDIEQIFNVVKKIDA